MQSGWFPHAVAGTAWRHARLRGPVALILLCAGVIGLLAAMAIAPTAAQTIDCSSQSTEPNLAPHPGLRDSLGPCRTRSTPDGVLNWAGDTGLTGVGRH